MKSSVLARNPDHILWVIQHVNQEYSALKKQMKAKAGKSSGRTKVEVIEELFLFEMKEKMPQSISDALSKRRWKRIDPASLIDELIPATNRVEDNAQESFLKALAALNIATRDAYSLVKILHNGGEPAKIIRDSVLDRLESAIEAVVDIDEE